MANNITLPGVSQVIGTEEISGVDYQKCFIVVGTAADKVGGEDLGAGFGLYVINLAKQESQGVFAHGDTVTAGLPMFMGAYALTSRTSPTPQTDGKMQSVKVTADGMLLMQPYSNAENTITGTATNTSGASTQVVAAQAALVKTYLTWVHLVNTSATPVYVEMKDGTTVMDTVYLAATSSKELTYPTPLPGTAATAWNFDPSAAATTITCTVGGFTTKV